MKKIKLLGVLPEAIKHDFKEVLEIDLSNKFQECFWVDRSESEIPRGFIFNRIQSSEGIDLHFLKIELKNISQQFAKPFDEIPMGWKTICKLEFIDKFIPEQVKKLPKISEWYSLGAEGGLYLAG